VRAQEAKNSKSAFSSRSQDGQRTDRLEAGKKVKKRERGVKGGGGRRNVQRSSRTTWEKRVGKRAKMSTPPLTQKSFRGGVQNKWIKHLECELRERKKKQ